MVKVVRPTKAFKRCETFKVYDVAGVILADVTLGTNHARYSSASADLARKLASELASGGYPSTVKVVEGGSGGVSSVFTICGGRFSASGFVDPLTGDVIDFDGKSVPGYEFLDVARAASKKST